VRVIPDAVWVALAGLLGFALCAAGAAGFAARRARLGARATAAASAAALTDPLTGALNRRGFEAAMERELARAARYERPLAVAYVDVRGLKAVNDTYGHRGGDGLLKAISDVLDESARSEDVVGRIGGDEFVVGLIEQSMAGAEPWSARIHTRAAETRAALGHAVPWALTIGLASFPQDGKTLDDLLQAADRRLYEQRGISLR
jgi:diguanylate cyclase (GGDEF)-like protein